MKHRWELPVYHLVSDNKQNNSAIKQRFTISMCPSCPRLYLLENFTCVLPFYMGLPVQILTKIERESCHLIQCYFKFDVLRFNMCFVGQYIMSNQLFVIKYHIKCKFIHQLVTNMKKKLKVQNLLYGRTCKIIFSSNVCKY